MALKEIAINSSKVICQADSSLYVLMELLQQAKSDIWKASEFNSRPYFIFFVC